MAEIENLKNLQDDILDRYNDGEISKKETKNILEWCEKQKKKPEEIIDGLNEN